MDEENNSANIVNDKSNDNHIIKSFDFNKNRMPIKKKIYSENLMLDISKEISEYIKGCVNDVMAGKKSIKILEFLAKIKENKNGNKKKSFDKLRFIYVCILFRESRHINALISEATYPCPNKFKTFDDFDDDSKKYYLDNDEIRYKDVSEWQKEFLNISLFFIKPGGYTWMYHGTKVGLRYFFEDKLNLNFEHELNVNFEDNTAVNFFTAIKAQNPLLDW